MNQYSHLRLNERVSRWDLVMIFILYVSLKYDSVNVSDLFNHPFTSFSSYCSLMISSYIINKG